MPSYDPAPTWQPVPDQGWAAPPLYAPVPPAKEDWPTLLVKYSAHGFAYSIIMVAVAFAWVFLAVGLTVCGACFGIIIAILLLIVAVGAINSFLSEEIWNLRTNKGVVNYLVHGLILLVLMLIANIPGSIVNWIADNTWVAVAVFIVYCPINGYVARSVAKMVEGNDYGRDLL